MSLHFMVRKVLMVFCLALVISYWLRAENPAQAIINGSYVQDHEAIAEGMVKIGGSNNAVFCSGILLTNDWVLTSNHCGFAQTDPTALTVRLGTGRNNVGEEYYNSFGNFVVGHPSLDFALIHLARPFNVPNKLPLNFVRGLYTGISANINKKILTTYGYGQRENNASGELYKLSARGTNTYDDYLFKVQYGLNQGTGSGDSGGPILTSSTIRNINVVVGVNKNSSFSRPETLTDWVLSYIYNRPVELPKTWYTPYTDLCINNNYCTLWDTPLKDNFKNQYTFDPCPGGSYDWSASYDLEVNDYIFLTSNGNVTRLGGYDGFATGSGSGPLTIAVQTDASKRSEGMRNMTYICKNNALPNQLLKTFASKWPQPLPVEYRGHDSFYPCADSVGGSTGFSVDVQYEFLDKDFGIISYFDDTSKFVQTTVTGRGSFKEHVFNRSIDFDVITSAAAGTMPTSSSSTPTSSPSPGFTSAKAMCDMKLVCHGPECFTLPEKLPNHNSSAGIYWDPCNGGDFKWKADYDMPSSHANLVIRKADLSGPATVLSGNKMSKWIGARGKLLINVFTDGAAPGEGLRSLKAVCDAW